MKSALCSAVLFICPAMILAAPCVPATLQAYVDLGSTGCEVDSWLFSDFTIAPVPPFPTLDPAQVSVTPGGTSLQPELLFGVNHTVTGDEQAGLLFHFVVSGGPLSTASVSFAGASTSGSGVVYSYLDVCPNGYFDPYAPSGCPGATDYAFATHSETNAYERSIAIPDADFYNVSLHLYLEGRTDSASLNSATIAFNAVPEPASAALMLTGLGVIYLGMTRNRRCLHR